MRLNHTPMGGQVGSEKITVYSKDGLLHWKKDDQDEVTACDKSVHDLVREDRPITWAGIWCTDCMTKSSGL